MDAASTDNTNNRPTLFPEVENEQVILSVLSCAFKDGSERAHAAVAEARRLV